MKVMKITGNAKESVLRALYRGCRKREGMSVDEIYLACKGTKLHKSIPAFYVAVEQLRELGLVRATTRKSFDLYKIPNTPYANNIMLAMRAIWHLRTHDTAMIHPVKRALSNLRDLVAGLQ